MLLLKPDKEIRGFCEFYHELFEMNTNMDTNVDTNPSTEIFDTAFDSTFDTIFNYINIEDVSDDINLMNDEFSKIYCAETLFDLDKKEKGIRLQMVSAFQSRIQLLNMMGDVYMNYITLCWQKQRLSVDNYNYQLQMHTEMNSILEESLQKGMDYYLNSYVGTNVFHKNVVYRDVFRHYSKVNGDLDIQIDEMRRKYEEGRYHLRALSTMCMKMYEDLTIITKQKKQCISKRLDVVKNKTN